MSAAENREYDRKVLPERNCPFRRRNRKGRPGSDSARLRHVRTGPKLFFEVFTGVFRPARCKTTAFTTFIFAVSTHFDAVCALTCGQRALQQDCRRLSKRALFRIRFLGIVPSERLRYNVSGISELIMQWRKNTPLNTRKLRDVFYWTYVRKTSLRKTKGCLPEALCVIRREPGSRR